MRRFIVTIRQSHIFPIFLNLYLDHKFGRIQNFEGSDEKCALFTHACNDISGYTITVDDDCKREEYSQLSNSNNGLFAWSDDIDIRNFTNTEMQEFYNSNISSSACEFTGKFILCKISGKLF